MGMVPIHMGSLQVETLLSITTTPELSPEDQREVSYLMLATLAAMVTLMIFVLGVFIMRRMGARLRRMRVGGEPTPYVDTWSQYRLSEDEIEAATAENESDSNENEHPGERP